MSHTKIVMGIFLCERRWRRWPELAAAGKKEMLLLLNTIFYAINCDDVSADLTHNGGDEGSGGSFIVGYLRSCRCLHRQ